jgi:hypothetical protein
MHRSIVWAGALLLTSATLGPVRADNALQLKTTFSDPKTCGNQFDPASPNVSANAFATIADNVNYRIENGDYLEYEVLIPKESTMAAGAVDLNLSARPKASNNGPTLRDTFVAIDQYGLFAHPATDYAILSTRMTQICGADGKPVDVPVFTRDQWFRRDINLSPLRIDASGNPVSITSVLLAIDEHNTTMLQDVCPDPNNPTALAHFRNVNIKNHDATGKEIVKRAIYNGEDKLPSGQTTLDVTGEKAAAQVSIVQYTPATNPSTGGGTNPSP